jgi:hypothetical protein
MGFFKILVVSSLGVVLTLTGAACFVFCLVLALEEAESTLQVAGYWILVFVGLAASLVGTNMVAVAAGGLRSPAPTPAMLDKRFRLAVVIMIVGTLLIFLIWQHSVYEDDMSAIQAASDWQERMIMKADAVKRNQEGFNNELAGYDLEIMRTEKFVPQGMELERFDETLALFGERNGIEIIELGRKLHREDAFDYCVIKLSLTGERETLQDLEEWPGKFRRTGGGRLLGVQHAELRGETLEAELVIFKQPDAPKKGRDYGQPEPWPDPRVLIWPFTSKVTEAMNEFDRNQQKVIEDREHWKLAERFQTKREDLMRRIDTINRIYTDERFLFPEDPRTVEVTRRLIDLAMSETSGE